MQAELPSPYGRQPPTRLQLMCASLSSPDGQMSTVLNPFTYFVPGSSALPVLSNATCPFPTLATGLAVRMHS